jgi:hypothetical protein
MEYVIPVVLVVLLVGGFVAFLVLNATRKSGPVADADEGAPGIGRDETPLGDTTEHAGEQTERGTTAGDPESGGRRRFDRDRAAHAGRPGEARAKPQPVTSEARQCEGAERRDLDGERPRPASERLADRDF